MADIQDNPPTNKYAVKEKVIPQLLKERLENRKKSKLFFIIYIVFNTILAIIGGLYFDCYYYTRNYIFNGDEFWEFYEKKQLDNKAVPLNAMLSGIICILTFCFNLMNLIVIGLYVIFGGVRDRLIFASKQLTFN